MKQLKSLSSVFFTLVVVISACSSSPESTKLTEIDELMIFVEQNYGEYRLLDSSFEPEINNPYSQFTQYLQPGIDTGYPYIFSYDLNEDGYNEYIFRVFRTSTANSARYDSVFEARTILVFGGGGGFIPATEDIGYRAFVFNDEYNYQPRVRLGIAPAGTYGRGYPFDDEITLSQVGLGVYSYLSVGVTEWINPDSSRSYAMYLD